ncbi:DUF397 domain-containing protein [Spiractinospora alimapuensis]|uniref:DUF397 domain-containing protein n=1 Tax=Spiractinospora alimapuensis TaxID=2820884 RepID=UPI001F1FE71F|nr:DUF397 domain-containing protein [Spiractinospora alimapuensis]QVQ52935.1 DUF397 domain-containing protein [Spiractinospora alimapuensis]
MTNPNLWHKSSYSVGDTNCVECRSDFALVNIRDTQHRHLGHLTIPATEWRAFLHAVREDELD